MGWNYSLQEEVIIVVWGDTVGKAGEVAQAGHVKPGARRDLQHASPRLVTQQLDLGEVEQVSGALPRQIVVRLLMQRQHLCKHDDLGQLGTTRLRLGSPVVGQLAPFTPLGTGRSKEESHDNPHDPRGVE